MPVIAEIKKDPPVPKVCSLAESGCSLAAKEVEKEKDWCNYVSDILDDKNGESTGKDQHVSWAAYHSTGTEQTLRTNHAPVAASGLLPLFFEDSKSIAIIRHSMNVIKKGVAVLNPGQVPVITCDQPLFKLAKKIQWTWNDTHGEHAFVVMLGGLHIKMALLKALGNLLDGSGWTSALDQAGIATAGTADSFLKAAHVKRTARAHQITACALFKLRQQSYADYLHSQEQSDVLPFDE